MTGIYSSTLVNGFWLLFLALILIDCSFRQAAKKTAPIQDFVYVCKDAGAGGYEAFPDIARMDNGNLICVFYAGFSHISIGNPSYPRAGRIVFCISKDEGKTWSKARLLFDGPNDDRDPSITQLTSGTLICNFFSLERRNGNIDSLRSTGSYYVTSNNYGKTWSKPVLISKNYYCSSPIRELSDGRLILGLYTEKNGTGNGAVTYSDDHGKTWSKEIDIDNNNFNLDAETDVIELKDKSLYAIQRPAMAFAKSFDNGVTWGKSELVGFGGHSPYLHRTRDGVIIVGYRLPSTSFRFSTDECATWSENILIDDTHGAYPSIANLLDASVYFVYYEEGAGSNIRGRRIDIKAIATKQ